VASGPQLSLVAYYGAKRAGLANLLDRCRRTIVDGPLGESFAPYRAAQVHATITGMESLPGSPGWNRNLFEHRGVRARMDLSRIDEVVRRRLPLTIRFGGFAPGDRPFESRGQEPYARTFQIHATTGQVTLIGWPHRDGEFAPRLLEDLRREIERTCNIAPKYDRDNDLYLVLGTLSGPVPQEDASAVERAVRDRLRDHPVDILIRREDLSIVRYEEPTLDPASTVDHRLADPEASPLDLEALLGA